MISFSEPFLAARESLDDTSRIRKLLDKTSQFQVVDLVRETAGTTLSRAVDDAGTTVALTRLRLDSDAVLRLRTAGVFDQAVSRLQTLEHEYLSRVLDGGQNEADGMPWVTSLWIDGKPLSE